MSGRPSRRTVCRRISRRISEVVPPGLGRWDEAFDLVEEASNTFLDALRAWELEDTPPTRKKLHAAADDLVRAWRLAGIEWRRAGCPGDRIRGGVPT